MDISTDDSLDVAYIRLRKGKVASSVELRPGIIFDLDQKGQVVGIEVLSLQQLAPALKVAKRSKKKTA